MYSILGFSEKDCFDNLKKLSPSVRIRITVLVWADILALIAMWLMITYLANVWKIGLTHAATIVNLFWGIVLVMPLALKFLVDTLMGNYWMVLLSSLACSAGLVILSLSTPSAMSGYMGTCSEYKPECIGRVQKILFYTALGLIAYGMSGHITSLGGLIDDNITDDTNEYKLKELFVVLVPITGAIAIPFIKPWSIRFGIPAICAVVATLIFLSGSCSYKRESQKGSPRQDAEVEEKKSLLRMIPICMTFILLGLVSSIGFTYFVGQADKLNRKVGHLNVPLQILLCFCELGKSIFTKFYMKLSGDSDMSEESRKRPCAPLIGSAASMIIGILCCITAAKVETRRLDVVRSHGLTDKPNDKIPMCMFWLVPQFILLGGFYGIFRASFVSFLTCEFPSSQRNYMDHIALIILGVGTMGSVLSVYVVGIISERGGKPNWFQDTLSKSRLDNYYWTLSAMTAVNFVVFILVATWYLSKDSSGKVKEREHGGHFNDSDDPKFV